MVRKLICFVLILLSVSFSLQAEVKTYPSNYSNAKVPASDIYEVSIIQAGVTYQTMVYKSNSNGSVNGGRNDAVKNNSISWTNFSFSGQVKVRVKLKTGQNKVSYGSAKVLPSRKGIVPTKIDNNTMEFTLTEPGQFSVEFSDLAYQHGLMLFADPLETRAAPTGSGVHMCSSCSASDVSNLAGKTAIYFKDGHHDIGIWQVPTSIKKIYIEGGALVEGAIHLMNSNNDNTMIYGRGILDGRKYYDANPNDKKHGIESTTTVSGTIVEGITVSQAGAFFVRLLGTDNTVEWVKTIGGWIFNNDGYVGYNNTVIKNCFVWANDDGIKLYRDNQTIENITAWHLTNGGVFQWCWNTTSAKNIRVKNVDIIRGQWPGDGQNQGVFNARGSSANDGVQTQTDWVFENIFIDNPVKVLFNLAPQVNHNISDVTFKNIQAKATSDVVNRIEGYSSNYKIKDISIESLSMNGTCINENNKTSIGKFQLNNTQNISFLCHSSPPLKNPVIAFTQPIINTSMSGNYTVKVATYDEDFGTTQGAGITSVYYQLFSAADPSTALFAEDITTAPFNWVLNTANFPNGDYELRAGVQSQDYTTGRVWTTLKPITINNVATPVNNPNLTTFTYPTAAGQAFLSTMYDVFVKQGNNPEQKVQTLMSDVNYRTMYDGDWMKAENKDRTFSFAQLDYNPAGGDLTIRVVKKFGNNSTSAVVSPKSYGYTPTITKANELTFKVNANSKYISVNFVGTDNETPSKKWIKNMLTIFVDPMETGKPSKTGAGVVVYSNTVSASALSNASIIYFPAGYHNLRNYTGGTSPINGDGQITLKTNQSIYLEGGAFVEGIIARSNYNDQNQRVFGRGIWTGRQYYWKNHPSFSGVAYGQIIELGKNSELQGIMYMESPNHGFVAPNAHVENVKFLGWHSNHDGIRVGSGSEIENSFLRAVDDHFYNFDIWVHDCVIWAGHNGAILTYGWGGEQGSNNYQAGSTLMENIDIINPEWTSLGNNNGLIMAQVGYNHPISDYGTGTTKTVMRNIRVEGSIPGITNLKPRSSGANNTAVQVPTASVTFLGDLLMENISVEAVYGKGLIRGEADPDFDGNKKWLVKDCEFKNITIGGVCVNEANKGQFFTIDANTVQNITFSCAGATPVLKDPVISFTAPIQDATISGNYTVKVSTYDEDFGTTQGATSVLYQLLDVNNPTTALFQETVTTAPFNWVLNTANYPNGQYELRAGVQSQDFTTTRKWAIVKPVTINNAAKDCAGIPGGTATVDACGICSGGTTGITPSSPITWYADTDNDGLGDPAVSKQSCTQPAGYVSNQNDVCPADATNKCNEPQVADIMDLRITTNTCSYVELHWTDVQHETAYRIRRKASNETTFTNLMDVPAGTTYFLDETVDEKETYVYMVRPLVNGVAVAISNTPTADVPSCTVTGLTTEIDDQVVFYPNPCDKAIHLFEEQHWRVYSGYQQLVIEGQGLNIDMIDLPSGTYFLRLENGLAYKVIKM